MQPDDYYTAQNIIKVCKGIDEAVQIMEQTLKELDLLDQDAMAAIYDARGHISNIRAIFAAYIDNIDDQGGPERLADETAQEMQMDAWREN